MRISRSSTPGGLGAFPAVFIPCCPGLVVLISTCRAVLNKITQYCRGRRLQRTERFGTDSARYPRAPHSNGVVRQSSNIRGFRVTPSGGTWKKVKHYFQPAIQHSQSQTEKYEKLCFVEADISAAPYKSKDAGGKTSYRREYDVLLLLGLTELKAQVSWIDSETVSTHPVKPCALSLTYLSRTSRRKKEGL